MADEDDPDELRDQAWSAGYRAAQVQALRAALTGLDHEGSEVEHAKWIVEREETVALLRGLCATNGDNDWTNDLHLRDVIEKHLIKYFDLDGEE